MNVPFPIGRQVRVIDERSPWLGLVGRRHQLEKDMQAVRMYDWAAESVEKVTKQHREAQACQRRLRQMQAKREKDAKRAARKAAEAKATA